VNCVAVRDRLTERALGTLRGNEGQAVDRHLEWCAACRKEAGELDRAAATLAFALAPGAPASELGDRVVAGVHDVATKGRGVPRRGRLAVALAVAAMVAISGLGWGAVMAGRAQRFADAAAQQRQKTADAVARFSDFINSAEFNDPGNQVFIGPLAGSTRGGTAGGTALTLASPGTSDVAIVMVNGLRPPAAALPLHVILVSEQGRTLTVGRITALDTGGNAIVFRRFELDLSRYRGVEVTDRTGAVILEGSVRLRPAITTPSP
jgi:hypothetical protein